MTEQMEKYQYPEINLFISQRFIQELLILKDKNESIEKFTDVFIKLSLEDQSMFKNYKSNMLFKIC